MKNPLPEHHNLTTTLLRLLVFFFGLIIILIIYTLLFTSEISPLVLALIVVYPGIALTMYSVRNIKVGTKHSSKNTQKIIVSPKSFLPVGWYRLSLSLWFILPIIVGFLFALEDEDLGFYIAILLFFFHWPSIYLFKWIKDGFNNASGSNKG